MSGAVSFVLGLLGLGAATGVSAVQDAGINKKKDQVAGIHCWEGDPETLKMRRRVRDEWMSLHGGGPNCLGKWPRSIQPADICIPNIDIGSRLILTQKAFRMMTRSWMR